jgi:DNA-binding transcriptional ArsR family regulator
MSETSASHSDGAPADPPPVPVPPTPPAPPAERPGKIDMKRIRITDPERMKALAHPARMTVFDFLAKRRAEGFHGATATEIAEVAGMTPSAMSYHLRTLAKAGFIEEAPSRGDARERVWRLVLHNFSIQAEQDAPESHRVIERTMGEAFREQQERNISRWMEQYQHVAPELRNVSLMHHGHLRLTMEEAEEFTRRFQELEGEYVDRSVERAESPVDPEDGTVVFSVLFRFFPRI